MRKFITVALSALLMCSMVSAQQTTRQTIRERKLMAKEVRTELAAKASKSAKKEAKTLKKAGWKVAPGQLPVEKQLDRSYEMLYEFDEGGLPKYVCGEANAVGAAYDAAKMQAVNNAKIELAGLLQTEVTALTESTVANDQMSMDDAASINKAVQAGKSLIAQKLGRTITVTEFYKDLPNGNVEVSVRLAYNAKMAVDYAKEVIKSQLEAEGKELHRQLDAMWGNLEK